MWHSGKTKPFLTIPLPPLFSLRICNLFHHYFHSHEDNSFNKTLANRIMVFNLLNYLDMACAHQNGIAGAVLTGTAEVILDESCFPKILADPL